MAPIDITVGEMIARGWENFLARPDGPLNFRFIIQPTIATLIAARAGWRDARDGRPPYLWAAFTNAEHRSELLHGGWKAMRTPFVVAVVLDTAYQIIVHRVVYPFELLFTATLLALVPYFVLRGPITRIAQFFVQREKPAPPRPSDSLSSEAIDP
jgi:hypothetical protein